MTEKEAGKTRRLCSDVVGKFKFNLRRYFYSGHRKETLGVKEVRKLKPRQPKAFFDWIFSQQGTKYQERSIVYPAPLLHPLGMETPDKLSNLAEELLKRGYNSTEVTKVLGGNWLRLFQEVWGE